MGNASLEGIGVMFSPAVRLKGKNVFFVGPG